MTVSKGSACHFKIAIFSFCFLFFLAACEKNCTIDPNAVIDEGNDPNFKIVANDEGILSCYNRKVEVFGIKIFAVPNVTDENLLHAANVMAQYLDNDEDGTPDNQAVVDKMVEEQAFIVMWKKQSDLRKSRTWQQCSQKVAYPRASLAGLCSKGAAGTPRSMPKSAPGAPW